MKREKIQDTYGGVVEVSLSSSASEPCMWIWCNDGGIPASGGVNDGSIHLNAEKARWLRDKLSEFITEAEESA